MMEVNGNLVFNTDQMQQNVHIPQATVVVVNNSHTVPSAPIVVVDGKY